MEKSAETAMVFYKFTPSAAAATPLNQKQYKIGVAYIVRNQNQEFSVKLVNLYFPLQKIR